MSMDNAYVWKAKLAAWTHDPAEKALVLLRDPAGHEKGTVAELRKKIFGSETLPDDLLRIIKRADRWAASADRPQFPRESGEGPYAKWAQVRFDEQPVLIHPLSGKKYDLGRLSEIEVREIKAVSLDHFSSFICRDASGNVDFRRTFLRFWREGPDPAAPRLGHLWRVLPADTRVPDHSIWEHLNLVSAFAGAMAADPGGSPALLKVTIGSVQSFIAQARNTSDLWSGSHLLSRMLWCGLQVLCEKLGPDTIIFPDLHGVPLVDGWLDVQKLGFENPHKAATEENPLFSAALPNVFVAIVPSSEAVALAREVQAAMRDWIVQIAENAARTLLESIEIKEIPAHVKEQIRTQLTGFPEVYWAAVPWNLAGSGDKADPAELARILGEFYPAGSGIPGFLSTGAWKLLSKQIELEGVNFYAPNPGVLYPALYDLLDRSTDAAKASRPFDQIRQEGYRCSLCGEREWLTDDRTRLDKARRNREETIWARVQSARPSWAKKGEHLCALCTLKRMWPRLFQDEVAQYIKKDVDRLVVSTHTMAMSATLEKIIEKAADRSTSERPKLEPLLEIVSRPELQGDRAVLPVRLYRKLLEHSPPGDDLYKVVTRLPLAFDRAADAEDDLPGEEESRLRMILSKKVEDYCGLKPERYYALILMDGDRMGAWVSGSDEELLPKNLETWHPQISSAVESETTTPQLIREYLDSRRTASPARHVAISRSLNGFAIGLARFLVEEAHTGKLVYAGGDDLLAMVGVRELLDALLDLRCAISGLDRVITIDQRTKIELRNGHAFLVRRGKTSLFRLMGHKATASAGAVVAHYSAPLGAVLRELRRAEGVAKREGPRDAFAITLMKRAGGKTTFASRWLLPTGEPDTCPDNSIQVLQDLRAAFSKNLTRQAAYQIMEWLALMPDGGSLEQAQAILSRQFRRHRRKDKDGQTTADFDPEGLSQRLVKFAEKARPDKPISLLRDAINLAEFLAREGRA